MSSINPYIYLKGTLECQFEALPKDSAFGPYAKVAPLQLQPRFRFTKHKKLTGSISGLSVDDPNLANTLDAQSWIFHRDPASIEIEDGNDFLKKKVFGIWFLHDQSHGLNAQAADGSWIPVTWQDLVGKHLIDAPAARGLEQRSFKAADSKSLHGRIRGKAIIRILDPKLPAERLCAFVHPDNLSTCTTPLSDEQPLFCDLHKPMSGSGPGFTAPTKSGCGSGPGGGGGCAPGGGSGILNTLLNGPTSGAGQGCWPSSSGCMGCSNSLWQMGCGLLSMLLALLLALWFIWCVLLGNCGDNQADDRTQKIPDTVYVEVIKEIKDTLKIIQRDTIAFVDSTKEESFMMVALPNVQFYTDQAVLLPSSSRELATVAEYMNKHPEATAEVYGHTDSVGDDRHNLVLSQRRAEAVRSFLMNFGVDGSRVTAKGFGESQPKASNATPEGRLMNRRVEMKLTQPKKVSHSRTKVDKDSINIPKK